MALPDSTATHDGFEVVDFETQEVVNFVPCTDTLHRDRVIMGMLRNLNTDRYFVRDTRWDSE